MQLDCHAVCNCALTTAPHDGVRRGPQPAALAPSDCTLSYLNRQECTCWLSAVCLISDSARCEQHKYTNHSLNTFTDTSTNLMLVALQRRQPVDPTLCHTTRLHVSIISTVHFGLPNVSFFRYFLLKFL